MKARIIGMAVVIVIVMALWLQREGKQAGDLSGEVLAMTIERISQIEGHQSHKDRIDDLVTRAHEQAFSFAYQYGSPGGRYRRGDPATFDQKKYLEWLFFNLKRELRAAMDDVPTQTEIRELGEFRGRVEELRKELDLAEIPGS